MAFVKVCSISELGPDGMASYYIEGVEVLVVRDRQGAIHALEGLCPHEGYPLIGGIFDGSTITCAAHGWIINAATGRGINPPNCRVAAYPLKLDGDEIHVDLDAPLS
jgi:toluene monooxygenase system ferredoxin subunit